MKLMLCEKCMDIVAPDSETNVVRWCKCRRHAVWWENPRAGNLVLFDGGGNTVEGGHYDGLPKGGPKVWVIGLHNAFIMFALDTAELVETAIESTPDDYLFKRRRSLVVKFRPLETGDTRWSSKLPGQ